MTDLRIIPIGDGRYKAVSDGTILGPKNKPIKQSVNYAGYMVCSIDQTQFRVNRVICQAFSGNSPTPLHKAAHKDGNRKNNNETNLYWASSQQNSDDMKRHNTQIKGSKVTLAKLTEADVIDIKARLARGESLTYIRDNIYSYVSYGVISHIKHGRTWRHV